MKKIAVIEDDELLNKALVITLEKEGYQVTAGKSCRDGIALLQNNPDLMLVDINLPDGNGISICREAERFSKIPVLFLRRGGRQFSVSRPQDQLEEKTGVLPGASDKSHGKGVQSSGTSGPKPRTDSDKGDYTGENLGY